MAVVEQMEMAEAGRRRLRLASPASLAALGEVRVGDELGLERYGHAQSVLVHRFGGRSEPLWYPYSARKTKTIGRILRLLWGTSLGRLLA